MNVKQVQKFVMRYLEATECQILEKHPAYVTVKLSPAADKDLTNRSYYWSFVDRSGLEPETMSFTFVFDSEKHLELSKPPIQSVAVQPTTPSPTPSTAPIQPDTQLGVTLPSGAVPASDSILARYFGVAPPTPVGRIQKDDVTYGSKRLAQIFDVVKNKGQFVCLFEEPPREFKQLGSILEYSTWLVVNWKAEFVCDMKRDELHSLGINLSTGEIVENMYDRVVQRKLTPRLPVHVHTPKRNITLIKAITQLETVLEKKFKLYDHSWATEAQERLQEELERIDMYYSDILKTMVEQEEQKQQIQQQYDNRRNEIEWQYKPRVEVAAMNCGIFHLYPLNITTN